MRDPQYKWLQSIVIIAYGIQKNTVGTLLVTRWQSCIPAGEEGLNTTRHAEIIAIDELLELCEETGEEICKT